MIVIILSIYYMKKDICFTTSSLHCGIFLFCEHDDRSHNRSFVATGSPGILFDFDKMFLSMSHFTG